MPVPLSRARVRCLSLVQLFLLLVLYTLNVLSSLKGEFKTLLSTRHSPKSTSCLARVLVLIIRASPVALREGGEKKGCSHTRDRRTTHLDNTARNVIKTRWCSRPSHRKRGVGETKQSAALTWPTTTRRITTKTRAKITTTTTTGIIEICRCRR